MSIWNVDMSCGITFGEGCRVQVADKLEACGSKNVLLVFDEAMDKFGYKAEIEKAITGKGIAVHGYQIEEGEPNALKTDKIAAFAKDKNIDAIVALGGGSSMDSAKVTGKLLANGGKTSDYQGYLNTGGNKAFSPVFMIPSTAGTGAEITPFASCGLENGNKAAVLNTPVTCAIVDPELTYDLPDFITANTGIDALSHSSEVLCNCNSMPNDFVDSICVETIRVVFKWLPIAYKDGKNKEARKWMSYAALLGGIAIRLRQSTFGHAIANQLSNTVHCPHGVGCSIGMTAFAYYNVTENKEWIMMNADALGIKMEGVAYDDVAKEVIRKYDDLRKLCKMQNLKDLGLEESYIDEMIGELEKDEKWKTLPVPPKFDIVRKVLHETYAS